MNISYGIALYIVKSMDVLWIHGIVRCWTGQDDELSRSTIFPAFFYPLIALCDLVLPPMGRVGLEKEER